MKTLMHLAVSAAVACKLVGTNLIAQTAARVTAKSSIAESKDIPLWPGVAPGLKAGLGTIRRIRPLAGNRITRFRVGRSWLGNEKTR
jgi:hypothetical protein